MSKKKNKNEEYRIYSSYDTETTNIEIAPGEWRAFPIYFMFSDCYDLNIAEYTPGSETYCDYRYCEDALTHIAMLIEIGKERGEVPIIVAYNLLFDLQGLLYRFAFDYSGAKVLARSTTQCYTFDLVDDSGNPLLRFWDTFFLEPNGVKAMGEACGVEKAIGDWDYSLIRGPETPLTDDERFYARRDTQTLLSYLRYILETHNYVKPYELGTKVLSKSSLVRTMANRVFGGVRTGRKGKVDRRGATLNKTFMASVKEQQPQLYEVYAARKAATRGGLTFTAAKFASSVVHRVCSLDVTSMHHAFICGKRIYKNFKQADPKFFKVVLDGIAEYSIDDIMKNYDDPLGCAFTVCVDFYNIRLKKGSVFGDYGIGTLAKSKFTSRAEEKSEDYSDIRNAEAEELIKVNGFYDQVFSSDTVFAFSKLIESSHVRVWLNECAFCEVALAYEWDNLEVVWGEYTSHSDLPESMVVLQSMSLYEEKKQLKKLLGVYEEGIADDAREVPLTLKNLEKSVKAGTISVADLEGFYMSTKAKFNGIYGTTLMDEVRPDYMFADAELHLDPSTKTTPENYIERMPKNPKAHNIYGARIVGWSRVHLCIAMELIYRAYGAYAMITGGDTDSLKVACNMVNYQNLIQALEPLHIAVTKAIAVCTERAKKTAPEYASDMEHVGCFEAEKVDSTGNMYFDYHIELWNKARVSYNPGNAHVTCAGLSRPAGVYHIENFIEDIINNGMSPEKALPLCMGYNVTVSNSIGHMNEHRRPTSRDRYVGNIVDYRGDVISIDCPEAIAIYPADRVLGSTDEPTNMEDVRYLEKIYNRSLDIRPRRLKLVNCKPVIDFEIMPWEGEVA